MCAVCACVGRGGPNGGQSHWVGISIILCVTEHHSTSNAKPDILGAKRFRQSFKITQQRARSLSKLRGCQQVMSDFIGAARHVQSGVIHGHCKLRSEPYYSHPWYGRQQQRLSLGGVHAKAASISSWPWKRCHTFTAHMGGWSSVDHSGVIS